MGAEFNRTLQQGFRVFGRKSEVRAELYPSVNCARTCKRIICLGIPIVLEMPFMHLTGVKHSFVY